jgi:hypothetical protein
VGTGLGVGGHPPRQQGAERLLSAACVGGEAMAGVIEVLRSDGERQAGPLRPPTITQPRPEPPPDQNPTPE